MIRFVFSLLLLLNLLQPFSYAQNAKTDSLLNVLKTIKADTARVNLLNDIGWELISTGDYEPAMNYINDAKTLAGKIKFKKGIANSFNNIGVIYYRQGNYSKALKNYFASLKIREEIGDKKGIAKSYNNIGIIYFNQGNYPEARKNHFASLKIKEEIGDRKGIAFSYNNIGNIYYYEGNYPEALKSYFASLKIREEIGGKNEIADSYNNIANIYDNQANYPEALKNYFASLKIFEEIGDKNGIATSYTNIGQLYIHMNKAAEGKLWLQKGLRLSSEIGSLGDIKHSYSGLAKADSALGNFKAAFEQYKMYIIYRDSIINEESTKKTLQEQLQYEYEKKEAVAAAAAEKQAEVAAAENRRQKAISWSATGGAALMLILAGISYRNYRNKRKANEVITHQKQLVEEKNREITDSIQYALRIQTAILPPQKIIRQYLGNSFVLYKPKDIVAGDFYWMETIGDLVLFAACDCTGHGVPGAMVSVVCHNALNRSVREFGLRKPNAILNKTSEIVIENFATSEENIKDGMDISLCALNTKTKTLQWAGANNPLWLMQNGNLIETKADKQPIGMHDHSKPFTNHEFALQTGDSIYIFSDGFADQFGGETGEKKLTKKRFKELLISIQDKTMDEQGNVLEKFILDYRKNVEQIDDILVMGVRV